MCSTYDFRNDLIPIAESFYNVKYWKVNYHIKCLSKSCLLFPLSNLNYNSNKFWPYVNQNAKMIFLGNYLWNLETAMFIFYVFITEIYLKNIWHDNWRSAFDFVKGLCYWTQFYCLSERLLGRFVFMVVWGCSDHRNTKQYKKVPILDLSSTCMLCKTKQSISVKIGNGQYAVFRATYLEKKVIL